MKRGDREPRRPGSPHGWPAATRDQPGQRPRLRTAASSQECRASATQRGRSRSACRHQLVTGHDLVARAMPMTAPGDAPRRPLRGCGRARPACGCSHTIPGRTPRWPRSPTAMPNAGQVLKPRPSTNPRTGSARWPAGRDSRKAEEHHRAGGNIGQIVDRTSPQQADRSRSPTASSSSMTPVAVSPDRADGDRPGWPPGGQPHRRAPLGSGKRGGRVTHGPRRSCASLHSPCMTAWPPGCPANPRRGQPSAEMPWINRREARDLRLSMPRTPGQWN